ncbi:dihydrofolate reductase family protein [Mucilaginibacter sp. JRF]|uniref:dihydrofolate reductase family protein n=1 Tax=Mucilaginibacter sp. JRF TaxID=2780088 RepID=UPI00187E9611|nr:dihydrofolate reductase family protein [Mucilaginibacter sp. JRF]MBE9584076.1 dihydrofolate reductase family protein [Mucilaginibacter sp. JRF]
MRKVKFGINISLDGYCDHTAMSPSEELLDYFTGTMHDVDLVFFGRVMYELMFPYWADVARDQSGSPAENRFAERFTDINKIVVSRSLQHAREDTRIIRENPVAELLKLKQQAGKNITMDSVSMLPEMIAADVIDEFNLVVHPVIVGQGRPLLAAGSLQQKLNLKLVDTIPFKSGHVALHYVRE